jgi:hypothetical protein
MKEYEVKISAYVKSFEIVQADNEDEAEKLAYEIFTGTYGVYNIDTKEVSLFTDVIAYEPEEITE